MKEIRITFRNEDFSAVSRSLIDLGVIFQVEPLDEGNILPADGRNERGSTNPRPGLTRKRPTKVAKTTAAQGATGAGRLRAMAERNRNAQGEREQGAETKTQTPSIPDDLSTRLLPYDERQEGGAR